MPTLPIYLTSAYLATSAFLFFFPTLLHTKHILSNATLSQTLQNPHKILKISHRGSPRYSTQNTIESFRKIFHISDCLEMDVCETADQVLVVHHDKNLVRSCGVDKDIGQCKFQDLPKYQDQIKLDFAVGRTTTTNNQKIPKLEDVFRIFQGVPMDIELKTPTQTAIKNFVELIVKYNREDHTIIGIRGNQNKLLLKAHKDLVGDSSQNTRLLTFMNDRNVYKLYLSYTLGLLPFIPIHESSLQIPIYSKQFQQWCVDRAKQNKKSQIITKIGCQLIKLMNFISKPLIWHLKQRGVMTFGWVCNTEEGLRRAEWMGVQGIMSDQPYLLKEFVDKREMGEKKDL